MKVVICPVSDIIDLYQSGLHRRLYLCDYSKRFFLIEKMEDVSIMTKFLRMTAILVLATAIMPLRVRGKEKKPQAPAKAAPAARSAPAARVAPAARPAPPARRA